MTTMLCAIECGSSIEVHLVKFPFFHSLSYLYMLLTFRMQLIVFIMLYRINLGKRSCVVTSGEVAYIMRLQ